MKKSSNILNGHQKSKSLLSEHEDNLESDLGHYPTKTATKTEYQRIKDDMFVAKESSVENIETFRNQQLLDSNDSDERLNRNRYVRPSNEQSLPPADIESQKNPSESCNEQIDDYIEDFEEYNLNDTRSDENPDLIKDEKSPSSGITKTSKIAKEEETPDQAYNPKPIQKNAEEQSESDKTLELNDSPEKHENTNMNNGINKPTLKSDCSHSESDAETIELNSENGEPDYFKSIVKSQHESAPSNPNYLIKMKITNNQIKKGDMKLGLHVRQKSSARRQRDQSHQSYISSEPARSKINKSKQPGLKLNVGSLNTQLSNCRSSQASRVNRKRKPTKSRKIVGKTESADSYNRMMISSGTNQNKVTQFTKYGLNQRIKNLERKDLKSAQPFRKQREVGLMSPSL